MENNKVFSSDITRTHNKLNNNLYDILLVDPVTPLVINDTSKLPCDFVPKTDKYFIPKKKIRFKVKTVRNIRDLFEKDIYSTLENDLEKQQSILLRKIRGGSSKNEKTKLLARNMLNTDKPISRMAWQMITNINPDDHAHPSQYVLYNGKCVQVNGSKGGKIKFISKYDLGAQREFLLHRPIKKTSLTARKKLLKHSLNVKFKPGPLSKKEHLDLSYQKYNIGNIKLAHLPSTGLDVMPELGKPLETSITNFLNNLRDVNGIISDKWAEFAISTLGTEQNGRAVQLNKDCCITFNLNYKHDQRIMLMRHGVEAMGNEHLVTKLQPMSDSYIEKEETIIEEVKSILNDMLVSVEINLLQDNMYSGEDLPRGTDADDTATGIISHSRDKIKHKGELRRLDVTIIRLSDIDEKQKLDACGKSFCSLGCVCDSILTPINLKNHCGRVECMFECRCDFSKYNPRAYLEDDIIPGLVNLDKEKNSNLSKEEKKFHQTVVLSGEKSILLTSQKRNWKAPKKYADFYSNMCLKTKKKAEKILSVLDIKLNCGNIEPWCMVHNLYKCFCKGKFTERLSINIPNDTTKNIENNNEGIKLPQHEKHEVDLTLENNKLTVNDPLRPRIRPDLHEIEKVDAKLLFCDETHDSPRQSFEEKCARTKKYKGRKYSDIHYSNINKKIQEMESNDTRLLKRMIQLRDDELDDRKKAKMDGVDSVDPPVIDLSTSPVPDQTEEPLNQRNDTTQNDPPISNNISLNTNIKSWLLPTLNMYGQNLIKSKFKKTLDPPKADKVALYPWDFILKRYHDRKNFFFVSNKKPFRLFLAVDNKNLFFNSCIDLNNIVDYDKYPTSVKNIITNDLDGLKDQFCILLGLDFCWEIVGSVTKVSGGTDSEIAFNESSIEINEGPIHNSTNSSPIKPTTDVPPLLIPLENNTDKSKWFVMTVENDFKEIQFYKKGFFVKYESIINAINVARISDNTVRLSSQKCNDGKSDPQFGIYAIPNANEYCVFIGPYEKNESLGIETVKSPSHMGNKRSRGVWITTNKIDNSRVVDNPLSFMSYVNLENEQVLDDFNRDESIINSVQGNKKQKIIKLTKPIKIAKTNNFYHLTSSGVLKQIPVEKQNLVSRKPFVINKSFSQDCDATSLTENPLLSTSSSVILQSSKTVTKPMIQKMSTLHSKRPIAEIAPQVKIVGECLESSSAQHKLSPRKIGTKEGGMFILKPEEINIRSLENKISCTSSSTSNNYNEEDSEIQMDIEQFLANSAKCTEPGPGVYVISDDEDYCNVETNSKKDSCRDVFIVCKNIENIGWISGRLDANEHLSFEFPGFKYTEFYIQEAAFAKINQVLSRKVYIPKHTNPHWYVEVTKENLKNKQKLKQEDLGPNFVLTKQGLIHKFYLGPRKKVSNDDIIRISTMSPIQIKQEETEMAVNSNDAEIQKVKLESQSKLLDEHHEQLWSEVVMRKGDISNRLTEMSNDVRQQISDRLRSIISNTNNS
ncbi:uncharacterized protein ocm [Epargyreus clarus]|uniref:uncharacterized protein ocm n=1 Tax=Epargyreus clarus TaxID=520877 RepID=UPI003C2E26ED